MTTKPATRLKALRLELRYWQMQARTELRWLKGSQNKCREIARLMREVQREQREKTLLR